MKILGVSAYYHDSAAALVCDGSIIAAAQEERFSRVKNDSSFPIQAITSCLQQGQLNLHDLDAVVFYDKPFLKFERLLETYIAVAPRGLSSFARSMPVWLKEKIFLKKNILDELKKIDENLATDFVDKLLFSEHHLSHAASAFFPSPFEQAAILTIDGVGEWTTTSLAFGEGAKIAIKKELHYPHSLGLLYSAFTAYCGFKVNNGEYKLMGLAPYGEPIDVEKIKSQLIDIKEDGSFSLNMDYFGYTTHLKMTNDKFHKLFGGPPRRNSDPIEQRHMNLAASIQKVTEEVMVKLAKQARQVTGAKNLCLAGGVALNCVANGKIHREKIFENIWVQPAAGDAGGALGAALAAYHIEFNKPRLVGRSQMQGALLGESFDRPDIERTLVSLGCHYEFIENEDELLERVAQALTEQKVVGWHQGRMEYGPRALGARSILGDPRHPEMQKTLNLKIKKRESFRPFAPSVLIDHANQWFEDLEDSPYMLMVAPVKNEVRQPLSEEHNKLTGTHRINAKRSAIAAVTHVDHSARVQTVNTKDNPRYYKLIRRFFEKTGVPILVNTSFNVRGEPIVCTPQDSYNCFINTDMDLLVVDNYIITK